MWHYSALRYVAPQPMARTSQKPSPSRENVTEINALRMCREPWLTTTLVSREKLAPWGNSPENEPTTTPAAPGAGQLKAA